MVALGKYAIIEADTLEARKRHRVLVEEALHRSDLSPEMRIALALELRQAISKEISAQQAEDEAYEEEQRKKKGESGGDQQGSAGGSDTSSSGSSSGGGMVMSEEQVDVETEDFSNAEMFELFLVLAAEDIVRPAEQTLTEEVFPLAATTLLFNSDDQIAHIHEPYVEAMEHAPHPASEFLPALEHHAATIGAQALQLRVHADMAAFFRNRGYMPYGAVINHNGVSLQRVRKTITRSQLLLKNNPNS